MRRVNGSVSERTLMLMSEFASSCCFAAAALDAGSDIRATDPLTH